MNKTMTMQFQQAIPTHIISGFLGVGKTTVLQKLLSERPTGERWAVLVNEFGEIGIDGAWLQQDGVAIKEVAGGCMCCAVGVPTQVALTRLLREQQPQRLFIEPSGLAHPKQLLELLSGDSFRGVIDMKAMVVLVEPECFCERRFLELPLFHDQLQMADVLVATKSDISSEQANRAFTEYCQQHFPQTPRFSIAHGQLPEEILALPHRSGGHPLLTRHEQPDVNAPDQPTLPEADAQGVIRAAKSDDTGSSCGWIFPVDWQFDEDALYRLISTSDVPRIKGIIITNNGGLRISKMRQHTVVEYSPEMSENRLEMIDISVRDWDVLDQQVRACRS